MDFDGANAYSVSNNSSINILPAWSPSGGQIVYTSFMRNNPDLYVTAAGGGRPKKLSSHTGMNTGAAWSPDGSKIALTLSKDGSPDIYVINASDGSDHQAPHQRQGDRHLARVVSPTAARSRSSRDRNGGPQIFVVSAAGGAARQVSFNGSYNTTPTWSPRTGKHLIAYTTRDGGHYDIVTLDLDTKAMVRVTQGEGNNEEPSFSPERPGDRVRPRGPGRVHRERRWHRQGGEGVERLGDRRGLGTGSEGLDRRAAPPRVPRRPSDLAHSHGDPPEALTKKLSSSVINRSDPSSDAACGVAPAHEAAPSSLE